MSGGSSPFVANDGRSEFVASKVRSTAPYPTSAANSLTGHHPAKGTVEKSRLLTDVAWLRPRLAAPDSAGLRLRSATMRIVNGNSSIEVSSDLGGQRAVAGNGCSPKAS